MRSQPISIHAIKKIKKKKMKFSKSAVLLFGYDTTKTFFQFSSNWFLSGRVMLCWLRCFWSIIKKPEEISRFLHIVIAFLVSDWVSTLASLMGRVVGVWNIYVNTELFNSVKHYTHLIDWLMEYWRFKNKTCTFLSPLIKWQSAGLLLTLKRCDNSVSGYLAKYLSFSRKSCFVIHTENVWSTVVYMYPEGKWFPN